MARYKSVNTNPQFLAVDLERQLLPGTFEHAMHHLLTRTLDLSHFDARFRNDTTGAPAYAPATLLQLVLFAYSRGIVSSRAIARACEEHVTFMALCGLQTPHFTTIAQFVSTLEVDIARVFAAVLAVCDQQGLIGREMFAIDGVKLPSHASKRRSGTRAGFGAQASKLEAAAATMLARHRATDALPVEPDLAAKAEARITRLEQDARQIREWLAAHPEDRRGAKRAIVKSNRTDNESAKMATSKGVIQGYTGVAAVDDKHQIICEAQAHGTGSEQALLLPVVTALAPLRTPASLITADAGYHSEANLAQLATLDITALIADGAMRRRDARFATQERHQAAPDPLHDKSPKATTPSPFSPGDFTHNAAAHTCVCPAGKSLKPTGRDVVTNGFIADHFRGAPADCAPCALRTQCLRTPDRTVTRQVAFFRGRAGPRLETHTARMKARIDTAGGRAQYGRRFATVEPVFANIRANKGLDHFTLRGRTKVDGQWKLFCLVHNIEKLAKHGYAA